MPRFPYAHIHRLLPDDRARRDFVRASHAEPVGDPVANAAWALRRHEPGILRSIVGQLSAA